MLVGQFFRIIVAFLHAGILFCLVILATTNSTLKLTLPFMTLATLITTMMACRPKSCIEIGNMSNLFLQVVVLYIMWTNLIHNVLFMVVMCTLFAVMVSEMAILIIWLRDPNCSDNWDLEVSAV